MSLTRIISGAALVVLVGGTIIWLPGWATVALAAVTAAAAGLELAGLARKTGAVVPGVFVASASAAMTIIIGLGPTGSDTWRGLYVPLDLAILSIVTASGLMALAFNRPGPNVLIAAGVMVLAPFYVGLPLGTMSWLVAANYPDLLGWLIVVIAVSDSFQYFVGSAIGRRKLSPTVSPGKTIEGLFGGLVAAAIVGPVAGYWLLPMEWWRLAILAVVLALFGVGGDLFESLLKRSVNAKDSGAIIPGHGGVLDRIDAYLFAAPVFYAAVRYLPVGPGL